MKKFTGLKIWTFLTNYFFLFLLLAGIGFNYYFQMKVNRDIKKYTVEQDRLNQQVNDLAESRLLLGKLSTIENRIHESVLSHRFLLNSSVESDLNQIRHDMIQIAASLRGLIPDKDVDELKNLVNEKIAFYRNVMEQYEKKGQRTALNLLADRRNPEFSRKLELLLDSFQLMTRQDILIRTRQLQQQRIDLISLDYAILQLTSFIFLVIAGFTLFKILQVFKLNRNLKTAVQKERAAQQVKDQFLSNMTHELRTPLNSVLGYTNLLLKSPSKKDQQKFIRSIKNAGEVLLNVINEVLDYSKLQSGYIRFTSEPFNTRDQLQNMADIIEDRVRDKGLSFHLKIDEEVPEQLIGDSGKLIQILLNITSNAVKFTSKGSISVTVSCDECSAEKAVLEFEIADTGVGIPKEKLPYIFERFYQVDGGTTRTYSGTGLGLAITQQLVQMQGGKIQVQSREGMGTRFFIKIPFKISNAPALSDKRRIKGLGTEEMNVLKGLEVLVVDDNPMNRDLIGYILKDLGFEADIVGGGREAIELLEKKSFDLILMDVQMPGMDGREATRRIRTELGIKTPIIALTAFSQPVERQRCLEAGMDGYLSKPIEENELLELCRTLKTPGIRKTLIPKVSPATLDIDYLKRIANGNQEFVNDVILKISETLPTEMSNLRLAVERRDRDRVNGIAHDMKTTFAVLGLSEKTKKLIGYLEEWNPPARRGNTKLPRVLNELDEICKKVSTEINKAFSGSKPAA